MTAPGAIPVSSITVNALDPSDQQLWQTVAAISRELGRKPRAPHSSLGRLVGIRRRFLRFLIERNRQNFHS
jgi:hypothetical protein